VNYRLTTPCDQCPYLKGSGFTWASLKAHASGEFPCHKASDLSGDGFFVEKEGQKTPHCAGALIFLEKQKKPHQMMRICERLGLYKPANLDLAAPVVTSPKDCR
jgi:hypothetical protein